MPTQIAVLQYPVVLEKEAMTEDVCRRVGSAVDLGAEIIVLPELCNLPYFCQTESFSAFEFAESRTGPTVSALTSVAMQRKVVVVIPFFEMAAPGLYFNSVIVSGPGGILGHYRKLHIPDDPGFYEKYYFTPGDLGYQVIPTPFGNIGTLICWDQWFPEAARLTAMKGADIIVYPTAIGWNPVEKDVYGARQLESWQISQRAAAIANGVFVASANRIGVEASVGTAPGPPTSSIEFWGHSFICDPQGVMLSELGPNDSTIGLATIDISMISTVRRNWPFFRDRRIDTYHAITRRFDT